MDILNIIIGLFMIGMGFLVKFVPNLIAGYNTMPEDKKKNVDIDGLSTYMRNCFVIMGLSIIIGYYLFKWMGLTVIVNSIMVAVILIGVLIMVINAQRFDHNKNKSKRSKFAYFILGLAIVFLVGLLTYGYLPSKAVIAQDTIKFTGMYGFEMPISEIAKVELTDKIPNIKMRTHGFSSGTVKKGVFNLNTFGESQLLVHSHKPPFLILSKNNGDKIIINFKDKTETENLYDEIKIVIDK